MVGCVPSQRTLKTAIVPIMKGGRAVNELFKEKSKKILQKLLSSSLKNGRNVTYMETKTTRVMIDRESGKRSATKKNS